MGSLRAGPKRHRPESSDAMMWLEARPAGPGARRTGRTVDTFGRIGSAQPNQCVFGVGPPENLQRSFRPLESSPEGASGHVQDGYVFRFPGVREELALGLPRGQAVAFSPAASSMGIAALPFLDSACGGLGAQGCLASSQSRLVPVLVSSLAQSSISAVLLRSQSAIAGSSRFPAATSSMNRTTST